MKEMSQAAASDGQVYTVNYDNLQPGTQPTYCPCLKTKKHHKIQLKMSPGQLSPYFRAYTIPTNQNLRIFIYLDTHFIFFNL